MAEFVGRHEGGDAETFFEANDAVLELEVVHAGFEREEEHRKRDDNPPQVEIRVLMFGPALDGHPDRYDLR